MVELTYVATNEQLADGLTKAWGGTEFEAFAHLYTMEQQHYYY